jgi:2-polyprenyl-6-methoxyphenol hydroxylase-like FAD-dependent oxidoreductase
MGLGAATPTEQSGLRAIVVGAGIGGLTTAIALRRRGIEARVFERAPDLRAIQVGYGIHLWTNAMRGLQRLGLGEEVEAIGEAFETMDFATVDGPRLIDWPVGQMGRKLGAPTVGLTRADLHAVLVHALGDGIVEFGSELVEYSQDADGVSARFGNGREERAHVLVGADGLYSAVRRQLLGDAPPTYCGVFEWHAQIEPRPEFVPPGTYRERWGRGARFGFYPTKGGLCWYSLVRGPEGGSDPEGERKAAVLERLRGWPEPTEALIQKTPDAAIVRLDILARKPVKRWSDGRVTLLGDAAHAMPPNMGQGSAQAIEDALVLSRCLSEEADVAAALHMYERRRVPRATRMANMASLIGRAGRLENPAARAFRNRVMQLATPRVAWTRQQEDMAYDFWTGRGVPKSLLGHDQGPS